MDFTAASTYGIGAQGPSYVAAAPTQDMAPDPFSGGWRRLVDPNNPLFWAGVVILVTLGAAGLAGSVRLGKARLTAELGQSS